MSYRPPDSIFNSLTTAGGTLVDVSSVQTLTNKTLTAPTISQIKGFGLNSSAKSADYTVLDGDSISVIHMTTSTTDRTVTLPTAAANTDRVICIKKVDSASGTVTIDGEGSETIDGFSSIVVPLENDFATLHCDGTEWHVIARRETTPWASFTPNFSSGFGTVSNNSAFWRRVGNSLEVRGFCTFGTVTAALGSIQFPQTYFNTASALLSKNNTNAQTGESVGFLTQDGGVRHGNIVTAPASVTNFVYLCGVQDVSGSNLIPQNISTTWASSDDCSYTFTVPITEWTDTV